MTADNLWNAFAVISPLKQTFVIGLSHCDTSPSVLRSFLPLSLTFLLLTLPYQSSHLSFLLLSSTLLPQGSCGVWRMTWRAKMSPAGAPRPTLAPSHPFPTSEHERPTCARASPQTTTWTWAPTTALELQWRESQPAAARASWRESL